MTKANPFAICRHCQTRFKKPVKRAVFCSLRCAMIGKIAFGKPDECWEWQGARKSGGYGSFSYNGKAGRYPHRAMLSFALGRTLGDKEETRHKCDNPPCCNPAHLEAGSRSDNMRDAFLRNRSNPRPPLTRGSSHYLSKLSEEIVRTIRKSTESDSALAVRYGVLPSAIWKARTGKTWSHVQ